MSEREQMQVQASNFLISLSRAEATELHDELTRIFAAIGVDNAANRAQFEVSRVYNLYDEIYRLGVA